ncbi:MAG: ABC transporter permease [Clostridiales bacterium]|nr:ABC transporter permease [Clostridiales bacterium]
MKMLVFARRNMKEILRDPLNLAFGLGFPVVLLLLLSAIQANIPVSLFEIDSLAPGIAVFGLSFITLFSATLISRDRGSALLQRLYTAPLASRDFILGYTLPLLPLALAQTGVCLMVALALGLEFSWHLLAAILFSLPAALFYIALGLLCGSIFTDKQVGGICGALLTNLSAWLSGIWFDLSLVGGAFEKIAHLLPFVHGVEMGRAVLRGNYAGIFPHMYWVMGYAVLVLLMAVGAFLRQMKRK